MRLNVQAFALTCGIVWGLGLFFLTWWMILVHGTSGATTFIGYFYLGYKTTPLGSIIGLVWAFLDGLIGGVIFAVLYNVLVSRTPLPEDS
jgi:hypothetical protein